MNVTFNTNKNIRFSERLKLSWVGYWIVAVSLIHTIFALVVFKQGFLDLFANGIFDAVGNDPNLGAVTWFTFAGFFLLCLGLAIIELEKREIAIPISLFGLLVFCTLFGVILMPESGFWLIMPALVGCFHKLERIKSSVIIPRR